MASVAYHQFNQFNAEGRVKLFGEYGGFSAGDQQRDFIFVDDVVAINLWFFENPGESGVFNLGTGRAQPFNDVALAVVNTLRRAQGQPALDLAQAVQLVLIEYIPFPAALRGKYQCYTQAALNHLRSTGCNHVFADLTSGVTQYMAALLA
jgi:ADP-L-glycero-D-manno-heptose 6-epimerase